MRLSYREIERNAFACGKDDERENINSSIMRRMGCIVSDTGKEAPRFGISAQREELSCWRKNCI